MDFLQISPFKVEIRLDVVLRTLRVETDVTAVRATINCYPKIEIHALGSKFSNSETANLSVISSQSDCDFYWFLVFLSADFYWFITGWWFQPSWKMMEGVNGFRKDYPIYEMENNPAMFQTTNQKFIWCFPHDVLTQTPQVHPLEDDPAAHFLPGWDVAHDGHTSNGRSATFGDQTSRFFGMRKWWDTTSHKKTRSILLDSTWGCVRLRKWRITCHNHPHMLHGAGRFTNISLKYHPNVGKCMEHMGSIPSQPKSGKSDSYPTLCELGANVEAAKWITKHIVSALFYQMLEALKNRNLRSYPAW